MAGCIYLCIYSCGTEYLLDTSIVYGVLLVNCGGPSFSRRFAFRGGLGGWGVPMSRTAYWLIFIALHVLALDDDWHP